MIACRLKRFVRLNIKINLQGRTLIALKKNCCYLLIFVKMSNPSHTVKTELRLYKNILNLKKYGEINGFIT